MSVKIITPLLLIPAILSADPVISDVKITASQVVLEFMDDGSNNQFELDRNPDLGPLNWANDPSANLLDLGNNRYRYTLSRIAADKEFYRVIGTFLGSGIDPDGDGLPTVLEETLLGANPQLRDTDGDGFDDGLEYALGTGINDANSKPKASSLPPVEFSESISHAFEERGTHQITIDTGTYSGPIPYTVNTSRSTAVAGSDFTALSGTTTASNGSATISLNLTDDFEIDGERYLVIDLSKNVPGNVYLPAGRVTHVVCFSEEDAFWSGVLIDRNTQRNFRLKVGKVGALAKIDFVSGGSDGFPTSYRDKEGNVSDISSSSQTSGVVPSKDFDGSSKTVWASSNPTFASETLTFSSPAMPVLGEKLFMASAGSTAVYQRVLSFSSDYSLIPDSDDNSLMIEPPAVTGTFTETITHALNPAITYLNATVTGNFAMTRQVPEAPEVPSAYSQQ